MDMVGALTWTLCVSHMYSLPWRYSRMLLSIGLKPTNCCCICESGVLAGVCKWCVKIFLRHGYWLFATTLRGSPEHA